MTIENHIENLKKLKSFHNGSYGVDIDRAVQALKQEQKMVHRETLEQVMWERDVAITQLKELGYGLGAKIKTDKNAISRQEVIDACEQSINIMEAVDRIMDLPSVKPQEPKTDTWSIKDVADTLAKHGLIVEQEPKTGHWIMPVQDDGMSDPMYYQVRCSKCGFDLDPQTWHMELHQYDADKYCPKCGTPMIEPQESEEE